MVTSALPATPRPIPLDQAFFERPTLEVARALVGTVLVKHEEDGLLLMARVVEVEAYRGDDPASHAYRLHSQGRSPSGKAGFLYEEAGLAYVYLNYGIHWMLNVVTDAKGVAGAVLIRALEPLAGIERMRERRPQIRRDQDLCNGPGKLTLSFAITGKDQGRRLTGGSLYFSEGRQATDPLAVMASARIGISRGQDLPWRFFLAHSPYISPSPFNKVGAAPVPKKPG